MSTNPNQAMLCLAGAEGWTDELPLKGKFIGWTDPYRIGDESSQSKVFPGSVESWSFDYDSSHRP